MYGSFWRRPVQSKRRTLTFVLSCYNFVRSSHQRCSLKNLSLFFNKVTCLRSATLLKKRLRCTCFPTNFVKFLIIPFPTEHLRWLLLFCYFYSDQRFTNRKYDEPLFFCSRFVGTTILKVIFLWCIIAKSFSCADF